MLAEPGRHVLLLMFIFFSKIIFAALNLRGRPVDRHQALPHLVRNYSPAEKLATQEHPNIGDFTT